MVLDYNSPVRPTAVGARIREERERLGYEGKLGEKDLAGKIGIHPNKIRAMEKSERLPDVYHLAFLAQQGVDINYVLTGQRPATPDESALLENYRAASPKDKDHMKAVGVAFAKSSLADKDEVSNN